MRSCSFVKFQALIAMPEQFKCDELTKKTVPVAAENRCFGLSRLKMAGAGRNSSAHVLRSKDAVSLLLAGSIDSQIEGFEVGGVWRLVLLVKQCSPHLTLEPGHCGHFSLDSAVPLTYCYIVVLGPSTTVQGWVGWGEPPKSAGLGGRQPP